MFSIFTQLFSFDFHLFMLCNYCTKFTILGFSVASLQLSKGWLLSSRLFFIIEENSFFSAELCWFMKLRWSAEGEQPAHNRSNSERCMMLLNETTSGIVYCQDKMWAKYLYWTKTAFSWCRCRYVQVGVDGAWRCCLVPRPSNKLLSGLFFVELIAFFLLLLLIIFPEFSSLLFSYYFPWILIFHGKVMVK